MYDSIQPMHVNMNTACTVILVAGRGPHFTLSFLF